MTFGQRPRVGISSLPIAPSVLDTLSTDADLNNILNVPMDIPLEDAIITSRNDNSQQSSTMNENVNLALQTTTETESISDNTDELHNSLNSCIINEENNSSSSTSSTLVCLRVTNDNEINDGNSGTMYASILWLRMVENLTKCNQDELKKAPIRAMFPAEDCEDLSDPR